MADEKPGAAQDLSYRLSTQDASFIYAESQSGPLHIGSIGFFEGRIDFDACIAHIEERIHQVPRYRQVIAEAPFNLAHAMMEDDPKFKVSNHVFRHVLPEGISDDDATGEMMREFQKPLDRKRPLWELHNYENLSGNRTALMWKVHHCLVDGVSGVELLKVMYDFRAEPEPAPEPKPWVPTRSSGLLKRFALAVRDQVRGTVDNAVRTVIEVTEEPSNFVEQARMFGEATRVMSQLFTRPIVAAPWNGVPVTQERMLAWSKQSFADFRAIRSAFGGSVNDVVLAMLSEGAARYLDAHGYKTKGEQLCIGCPVNVRHREEKSSLGNRVSMMFPVAHAEPMDMIERLKLINEETERIKAAGSAQALEVLLTMGDNIPPALIGFGSRIATNALDAAGAFAKLARWKPKPGSFALPAFGINFIATNVPGVQVPQYMNGHICLEMVPLVPLGATLGYGVAILSYNRNLYFGMISEPRVMPDVALMKQYVDEAFEELKRRCEDQLGASLGEAYGQYARAGG
jgi:diacylglycerol O-acyltransferase / wax synthase